MCCRENSCPEIELWGKLGEEGHSWPSGAVWSPVMVPSGFMFSLVSFSSSLHNASASFVNIIHPCASTHVLSLEADRAI